MNRPPPKCFYCDRVAVAYCDFVVYRAGFVESAGVLTCDRPICDAHCNRVGHLCFRGKNKKQSDTIDHCREHGEQLTNARSQGAEQ